MAVVGDMEGDGLDPRCQKFHDHPWSRRHTTRRRHRV